MKTNEIKNFEQLRNDVKWMNSWIGVPNLMELKIFFRTFEFELPSYFKAYSRYVRCCFLLWENKNAFLCSLNCKVF